MLAADLGAVSPRHGLRRPPDTTPRGPVGLLAQLVRLDEGLRTGATGARATAVTGSVLAWRMRALGHDDAPPAHRAQEIGEGEAHERVLLLLIPDRGRRATVVMTG